MTGVRPGRCPTAINTAWTTNWRSCRGLIAQPPTTPEYKSSRMQRYRQCSAVRTSVMSVTHFGVRCRRLEISFEMIVDSPGLVPEAFQRQRPNVFAPMPSSVASGRTVNPGVSSVATVSRVYSAENFRLWIMTPSWPILDLRSDVRKIRAEPDRHLQSYVLLACFERRQLMAEAALTGGEGA